MQRDVCRYHGPQRLFRSIGFFMDDPFDELEVPDRQQVFVWAVDSMDASDQAFEYFASLRNSFLNWFTEEVSEETVIAEARATRIWSEEDWDAIPDLDPSVLVVIAAATTKSDGEEVRITGMDLSGVAGRSFRFERVEWANLLNLAVEYGWSPKGTRRPAIYDEPRFTATPAEWDGGYMSNDYQRVFADDAAALADAVESALPDIPDIPPVHKLGPVTDGVPGINPATDLNIMETFAGPKGKQRLRDFIEFCREGEFRIG